MQIQKIQEEEYNMHCLTLFQQMVDYLPYTKSLLLILQQAFSFSPSPYTLQAIVCNDDGQ